MPIPPDESSITRSLLRDDVFRRLRDGIVDGTFEPGEQLRDLELATWLGCSRTPVREALLRLADVGLVVASPGRSTVVAELDLDTLREARDVVAGMHAVAVRQAIEQITDADLDEMRSANADFAAATRAGDLDAAHLADRRFHAVPLRIAGNSALLAVLDQYEPVLRRAEKARFAEDDGLRTIRAHDRLVERLDDGDSLAAAALTYDTWHSLGDESPS